MPLVQITGPTISAGQSLSNSVQVGGELGVIFMPGAWSGGNLSIQISPDDTTYFDLIDSEGQEAIVPVIAGAAILVRGKAWTSSIEWVRFRSGTRQWAWPQSADRVFRVSVQR